MAKADSLGDKGLSELDKRVPIIKDESSTEYVTWPYTYLMGTWEDEYKKTKGEGVVKSVKAVVSTELKVTLDAWNFLVELLRRRGEEGKKVVGEKTGN